MKYFILLVALASLNLFADDNVYLSQKVLTVSIEKNPNECSQIVLHYSILTTDDLPIPKGITGLNGDPFLHSVLRLRNGYDFAGMNLPVIQDYGSVKKEYIVLKTENSPHTAIVELKDFFNLVQGGYYLSYGFSWDLREREKYIIADVAASERYYVEVDSRGCVQVIQ